jgi:HPt (histidine-containing phosphotransfer) domain-containing protein
LSRSRADLSHRESSVTAAETAEFKLPAELYEIRGLEVQAALTMLLDRKEFYLQLLHRFCNERIDVGLKIRMDMENGRHESAMRHFHSMKSLAATIGATPLQNISANLEQALQDGIAYEELFKSFEEELYNLICNIQKVIKE